MASPWTLSCRLCHGFDPLKEGSRLSPGQANSSNSSDALSLPLCQLPVPSHKTYKGILSTPCGIVWPPAGPLLGHGTKRDPDSYRCTRCLRSGGRGEWRPSSCCVCSPRSGLGGSPRHSAHSSAAAWWCPGPAPTKGHSESSTSATHSGPRPVTHIETMAYGCQVQVTLRPTAPGSGVLA